MKFNEKKHEKKVLTDADKSAIAKAKADARAADRKVAESLAFKLWEGGDPNKRSKLSFKQLRGELKRIDLRDKTKEGYVNGGLGSALASVLLTVLDNTQSKENPFGKLASYPR
jgi:hypothetical protein